MKFKDLPAGTSFTIRGYKTFGGLSLLGNIDRYLEDDVEVTPIYEDLKPFTRIKQVDNTDPDGSTCGLYLKKGWVFWDNLDYPDTLNFPATTEYYENVCNR